MFNPRVLLLSALAVLSALHGIGANAASYASSEIYRNGPGIPSDHRHFVQVMGGETEKAARIRAECLAKTHPELSVATFKRPVAAGIAGAPIPFAVVIASYVKKPEADKAAERAMILNVTG